MIIIIIANLFQCLNRFVLKDTSEPSVRIVNCSGKVNQEVLIAAAAVAAATVLLSPTFSLCLVVFMLVMMCLMMVRIVCMVVVMVMAASRITYGKKFNQQVQENGLLSKSEG